MLTPDETKKLVEYIDKADYYKSIGDFQSAIECYENFIKIEPNKPALYSILANMYAKAYGDGSIKKQIFYYKKLLELNPNSRIAQHGLAFSFEKLKQNDLANKYYNLLLQNNPTDTDYYNYGMFLIHIGDFTNGHKFLTKRFNISDNPILQYPISLDKKWDFKTDISDKTLLVHYEQGFGDTIMYCRFIPQLKNICKKLIFVVQKELFELISKSEKIANNIEIVTTSNGIEYDYSMALLDTPYVLNTTIDTIPFCDNYLESSTRQFDDYFKIGIAYAGDVSANYNSRNIELQNFYDLSKIKGVQLYSLQKNDNNNFPWLISLGNDFNNFSDTAKAIKGMDMVISADNVILNLAGALGIKTIGLFNEQTNYRWYKTEGNNVGWYNSVKPLQCKKQNHWEELFNSLSQIITTELTYNS